MRRIDTETRASIGAVSGCAAALLALVALAISLSGIAAASPQTGGSRHPRHGLITAARLAPGAVTAKALAPGAVHAKALSPGAVHPKALAGGAVTSASIADGAVNNRTLAGGAVGSQNLADGAVIGRVLAKGSVTPAAIASDAVTAPAIAPGSVYGGALTTETVRVTSIGDLDGVAENGTWTASNTEVVLCSPGERLLGTGFLMNEPGNREVSWLRAAPFFGPQTSGVSGQIRQILAAQRRARSWLFAWPRVRNVDSRDAGPVGHAAEGFLTSMGETPGPSSPAGQDSMLSTIRPPRLGSRDYAVGQLGPSSPQRALHRPSLRANRRNGGPTRFGLGEPECSDPPSNTQGVPTGR